MLWTTVSTGLGIAFANAVVIPAHKQYQAWKASRGEVVLKRDARGRLVPDLTVRRIERAAWFALLAFIAFGLAVGWNVMTPQR